MESSKIYLCKADCSILGNISGLKIETCSLKKHAVEQWEITFDIERYSNDNSCKLKQSDYYDSIDTMMRLYLDGKDQIFFVIDSEPVIKGEGLQEIKTVTAHSIECELSTLILKNFKINCGTKDSQEYLVTDSNGNFNNINPYTNLPYEYISLVNYDNPQLSLLHLVLQNTGWAVGENINPEICNIKRNFDISSTNIYDFFTNTVSPSASVIFQFDRKHKKVGLVKADNFGEYTGIFVTMRNLMKNFEISASSNDELITRLYPTGADNLSVEQVNFGKNYITSLDHFMNIMNEYGDYKYVSKELHDKYILWKNYREIDKITFNGKKITRREQYIELSKLYNKTILDINELKNRVPNDGAVTDYKTFSLDELKLNLNAFNKALVSLITIYKNEYGVTEIGDAPNYTPTPSSAVNIKDTPYWHDYYAYQESIIPQIKEALKMYCQTDSNGNLMTDINGHFIEMEFGNSAYYADPSIVKEVDAYKYEWSLYGLDELESKKKAWSKVSNILFNECFIKSGTTAAPTAYRTPDDNGWNSLSDAQKKEFTSKSAYFDKLNQYLDYMSFDSRNNSLTKTNCKGIIRQCEDAIISRKNEIASLETLQNNYQTQRKELSNSVAIENFKVNNVLLFTEKDLNVIKSMIREQDYNNSNILTTNPDDIVTSIDAQEELYQAAVEELYKLSQPQYSFSTDMENLYALEEFQCYHDDFEVGNFIRAGFEIHEELFNNEFIKLRLMSITYNPLDISSQNLSVEFSTMTKELNGVSDLASLLGENSSLTGSSSSGSSSSGNGGTYGNNDANVQMSNNMINALLSTELFGTTITDVILDSIKANKGNFNTLLSHSGIFDSLEAGRIKVSGDCLFDRIMSNNYSSIDKIGSFFNIANGKFESFSTNGHYIKNDGNNISVKMENFSVDNKGNAFFKGDISGSNGIFSGTLNGCDGNFTGSMNVNNHFVIDEYGNVTADGTLKATNANITGVINATKSNIMESVFIDGDIEANKLIAKNGEIGAWKFDNGAFYKDSNTIGNISGKYFGNDGLSISDYFVVNNEGIYLKDKNLMEYTYNYYISLNNTEIELCSMELNNVPVECWRLYLGFQGYVSGKIMSEIDMELNDTYIEYEGYCSISRTPEGHGFINLSEGFIRNCLPSTIDGEHLVQTSIKVKMNSITLIGINDRDTDIGNMGIIECNINTVQGETFNISPSIIKNKYGLEINMPENCISSSKYKLEENSFNLYEDFSINIKPRYSDNPVFKLNKSEMYHNGLSTSSTGSNLIISDGNFYQKSSSSKRYKNSIVNLSKKSKSFPDLDPHKLYDINVVSFRYNDDYLPETDQRYQKDIPGFIADDVYEKYPIACNLDKDGNPEMWDINILFPAALKLIQDLHKDMQKQHEETESIKQQFKDLKTCIIS